MNPGFEDANSNNLPIVDYSMIDEFYNKTLSFISSETRGTKNTRSSREVYGDNAVGFVQLKRENSVCHIQAKITPEHKVTSKPYTVTVEIQENDEIIMKSECLDCAAAAGGCKHGLALLFWLLRRSEEPSTTAVECYWKKSELSKVGSSKKFIRVMDMEPSAEMPTITSNFLQTVISKAQSLNVDSVLLKCFKEIDNVHLLSIHHMYINYFKQLKNVMPDADTFLQYCTYNIQADVCAKAEKLTRQQSDEPLWYELRYARVTASKIYETSKCSTLDGTLIELLLGGTKLPATAAMERGTKLESEVFQEVCNRFQIKFQKSGLHIYLQNPIIAASPDGISIAYCLEIKCPSKEKNIKNYLVDEKTIAPKYYAQLQLQLHITKRDRGLFVVAFPNFEETRQFKYLVCEYDKNYCDKMIKEAVEFWKKAVFPHIQNIKF